MKIKNMIMPSLGLAGMGIGLGYVADNFTSSPEISSGLSKAGAVSTSFIAPVISISAGGYIVNQLRNLNPKQNKEDKNGFQNKTGKIKFKL